MIAMKFGGTSVQDTQCVRRAAEIIKSRVDQKPVVVLSAMGKVTDDLVDIGKSAAQKDRAKAHKLILKIIDHHKKTIKELELGEKETKHLQAVFETFETTLDELSEKIFLAGNVARHQSDELLSMGEFLSVNVMAAYLRSMGYQAEMADSRELLLTDSQFTNAQPLIEESTKQVRKKLLPLLEKNIIPITQGFIGRDTFGRTTTLGRGGSDYTATLLAAMIDCEKVEIWSDVDGVLTADPSIVKDAKRIRVMSFHEASELAYFGAKVLHPATLLPAIDKGIPVYVLNSSRPEYGGTKIANKDQLKNRETCIVKSIAYKEDITVIKVTSTRMLMAYGFIAKIFEIFEKYETAVDLVSTAEVSVTITVDNIEHLDDIKRELERVGTVQILPHKAIVCLVGEKMVETYNMPGDIFNTIRDSKIYQISQGASEINISFVIDESEIETVVNKLHNHFFTESVNPEIFDV